MTFQQELASWNPFTSSHKTQSVPDLGEQARSVGQLKFPRPDKKPTIIAFLRHCGCPCMIYTTFNPPLCALKVSNKNLVAEKTFKNLKSAAESNKNIHFIAVSHSDQDATSHWLENVGGPGSVEVIVDSEREIYGTYGLGLSSMWHALNPWSVLSVFKLGRSEQIWNRPTESGSRWQTAGMFGVNDKGYLEYVHVAQAADDLGDLNEALTELKR